MCGIWVNVGTAQDPPPDPSTWMPDANLRAAVLARLKIFDIVDDDATTFTQANLEDTKFISLSEFVAGKITDITGLEYATHLTDLKLTSNSISDISVVSSLTNLTQLYLNSNSISDISVVSGLTNLTRLNLSSNNISDISAVSGLTQLEWLFLSSNNISDISAVSGLTNLTVLNLDSNNISDISAVSGLTNLTSLSLGFNNISDISAVSGLTDLTYLILIDNNISDISAVSGLTNLTQLYLSRNRISRTDEIIGLTKLERLSLDRNWITDVNEFLKLAALSSLTFLELDGHGTNSLQDVKDRNVDVLRNYLYVPPPPVEADPEPPPKPKRKIIIYQCPVGWQRTDGFARPNPRVLLYEVNLEIDLQNRVSIYKPNSVAIYVHPDEGLENLDGWKLQVAIPYNYHRDYLLTAENAVVVDANIEGVEGGFAFIENPEEDPFPMVGMGFTGAAVPGFDYRLYDERGRKVDFGIACYKQAGIFQALRDMEDPKVLRKVLLESLDWDAATYIRSEWTVPAPAPAAPSLVKKTIVGTWADLKKQ